MYYRGAMTADVNANVNVNVSTIETEDKCGLDMSGYEGLPTIDADCNGFNIGNEVGKANAEDFPHSSYIFVAGTDAVAEEPVDTSDLNGNYEPIEKVGSRDVEVDNDAADLVVDHSCSPMKNELPLSNEKQKTNGAFEVSNGGLWTMEAEKGEVDLNTVVERSKEFKINVLETDSENKSLEVSVNGENAEVDDNIGSTVTEKSQATSNADIAKSEPNHSDNVEVENCKNIVESEQSPSGEAEVISCICIAESGLGQPGKAEIIGYDNIAESEQSQSGEAEAISSNKIAESDQSGKVEAGGESELNQSDNPENMVEASSERNLVSYVEKNQDSSITYTEGVQDNNDMDLNHGRESVGFTNNVSKDPQEASEVELAQNTEVVEAGVKLETAEVVDPTLSDEYVNRLSAVCAENGVAETNVVNGIAAASQTTPVQNGGSEGLGRSENLTSSDAEIGISYPAARNDDSIKDSKNEFNMPVLQLVSETINGHVTCQNGETLPADHAKECDSHVDFSHPRQNSPKNDKPSKVSEAVLVHDVAIANHESNPASDTALEVDNGYSCCSDAVSEPVVENGHSHPIRGSETYETRTETVDQKFKTIPSIHSNDAILETEVETTAIKFGDVPAVSSDVVNIESEVSVEAANDFGGNPDREACAHDLVETAVDVKAESEVENSLMLPREVPCDDGPASESELVKNPVDVKADSEIEDSLVLPRDAPHDDCPQSESVLPGKPIDVTAESLVKNSSMFTEEHPCADGPLSEFQVLDGSVHSGGRTSNDLLVENKGNQLLSIDCDEKKSEETVVANADNQGEASASSLEAIDGQNLVVEGRKRPFYYMIKIPRYDNGESLREKIKHAQNQVDEKTKIRDVIRAEMQKQRACCNEYGARLDDAISEETAARGLLKAKRKEIDSVLLVINKVRSARDVGDIDNKIRNMEHMLQHETLALKEEKNYIRTIQQLKQTREQLSSSLGNQEDVQEALNQKEQVEDRLKNLRKEADQLRENVFKAEGATKIADAKFQHEKAKLTDLTMQFRAADDVRQQAYADMQSLKKQLYDKNKYFWKYKDDAKAAYDLAFKGDKEELQSHCINQVERVMELWKNNDEFRSEYIRCNIRSTLRRLRTLDGRSLGPDEEPPVIPYVTEGAAKENIIPSISTLEEESTVVPVKKTEKKDDKSPEKLGDQSKPKAKLKKPAPLGNGIATVSGSIEMEEAPQQEENKPTKEETELMRKAEESRKLEEAAILREQYRLEEKAKAKEALERKKRNADKAQARAALRAQKEAEQKEKEREKRARKKEKRKAVEEVNATKEAESTLSSELPPETKVSETGEKPITQIKRSQKPSQFTKQIKPKSSMPLPLRNRSKRRIQTWMWALVAALIFLSIFLVGNNNFSLQRFGFPRLKTK